MQGLGTGMSAGAQYSAGVNASKAAEFEAQQALINAGQAKAASQRTGADVERRAKLLESRALAVAAASGGGASDPSVVDIISGIAGEGSYRSALARYEGDDKARTLETQADAARFRGRAAKKAGIVGAFGTILGSPSAMSMYKKYGQGGADVGDINWDLESGMG